MTRKIIFDTDPGVDDATALLLIDRHPALELVALTTIFGNADIDSVTRNALWLRELLGFRAPIARGPSVSLDGRAGPYPAAIHGADGLGGQAPAEVDAAPDPRPAHQLISDVARQSGDKVTIIAVGRLTNVALALMHDPGLPDFVEEVVIMGGAFGAGNGNVTPAAEANIIGDPVAADIVFGARWKVTAVGLDVTRQVILPSASLEGPPSGDPAVEAIRLATLSYMKYHERFGLRGCYVHDASAVACVIARDLFDFATGPVRVVRTGIAQGQTIRRDPATFYPPGEWDDRPDQSVAVKVDATGVLALVQGLFARELQPSSP